MTSKYITEWHKGLFNTDELNFLVNNAIERYDFKETLIESIAWIKSDGSRQARKRVSFNNLSTAS